MSKFAIAPGQGKAAAAANLAGDPAAGRCEVINAVPAAERWAIGLRQSGSLFGDAEV